MIKKFEEFVNEGCCCGQSWNDNELEEYISGLTHEPEGVYTDDDGYFELSSEPEYTANDIDTERFCIEQFDNNQNLEFVGIYTYYNNITGKEDNTNDGVVIWYDKKKHEFGQKPISWDEVKEYILG